MLTGRRPFDDDSVHKLLDKIIVGDFKFPSALTLSKQNSASAQDDGVRYNISEEAKDLVKRILNPNPRKRFTIEQIMMHPWMHSGDLNISSDSENDLEQEEDDLDGDRDEEWSQSEIQHQRNLREDFTG
jgi:serine/threonine protein kinase